MKIWVAITALVFIDAASSLSIAQGMKQISKVSIRQPQGLRKVVRNVIQSPHLRIGFFLQIVTCLIFLTLLSWANLSLVVPLASIGIVVNVLGAQFLLKEKLTPERWLGIACICCGVVLAAFNSST